MRLLWIATKPPAPPVDGGRLVALLTLEALARQGADITLVAPVAPGSDAAQAEAALARFCRPRLVPAAPRHPLRAALGSVLGGRPYSIARHALPEVRDEVARLLDAETFDAVHAEQLHAFAQAEPALAAGVPVVLRAQNVESDLWQATARLHRWAGPWLAREARRLARYEGQAVQRASATVALTERDAARLRELAGAAAEVVAIPPPFPSELPPADHELAGEPPLVLLGSGGWLPNREGTRWFLEDVWPEVRSRVPGAVLHLYASPGERPKRLPPGVEPHPPPSDSRDAFAPNAVLVVPLRIASGIRMKILEAWARGVPVVATPEAAAGLWAEGGRELVIAGDPAAFATEIARLGAVPEARAGLVAAGRAAAAAGHRDARVARELLDLHHRAAPRGRVLPALRRPDVVTLAEMTDPPRATLRRRWRRQARVGFLWDSLSRNLGDQAIGVALLRLARRKRLSQLEPVEIGSPIAKLFDVLVIGGGELLQAPGHPYYDLFRVPGEHILNTVGTAGPLDAEYLSAYRLTSVRSQVDRRNLENLDRETLVAPCVTVLFDEVLESAQPVDPPPDAVGIHLHPASFQVGEGAKVLQVLQTLHTQRGPIAFIPFTHYNRDREIQSVVASRLDLPAPLPVETPDQAFEVIRGLSAVITTSLHATIMAYVEGVPFVAVAYAPKVAHFLEERGLAHRMVSSFAEIADKLDLLERSSVDWSERLVADRRVARDLVEAIVTELERVLHKPPRRRRSFRSWTGPSHVRKSHAEMIRTHEQYGTRMTERLAAAYERESAREYTDRLERDLAQTKDELERARQYIDVVESELRHSGDELRKAGDYARSLEEELQRAPDRPLERK